MTAAPPDPLLLGIREWQQSLLLSHKLRQASRLLLLFFFSALLTSFLPLQLFQPAWYLKVADVLMANAPIAITAACLSFISLVLNPIDDASGESRKVRFQRFFQLLGAIYFALLPVVLVAGAYLILELNTSQQLQLNTLQQQQQQMAQRLRSAASIDELSALLPPGSPQPAGATLSQRRSNVLEALANAQLSNSQRLSQLHDQRLLKLLTNSLRILLTALPTGLFFRMVAKPSYQLFNAVYEQLDQG